MTGGSKRGDQELDSIARTEVDRAGMLGRTETGRRLVMGDHHARLLQAMADVRQRGIFRQLVSYHGSAVAALLDTHVRRRTIMCMTRICFWGTTTSAFGSL